MTSRLDALLEELIQLTREDRAAQQVIEFGQPRLEIYGSIDPVPSTGSLPESDLIAQALMARIARLWLDTLYASEFGSLYVAASGSPYGEEHGRIARLQTEWESLCRFPSQVTRYLARDVRRWSGSKLPTTSFLILSASAVLSAGSSGLMRVVECYTAALRGHWVAASKLAIGLVSKHATDRWNRLAVLLAANFQLNAGKCLQALQVIDRHAPGWRTFEFETVRLVAAARLQDAATAASASNWLDSQTHLRSATIEASIQRRRRRIAAHVQSPMPGHNESRALHQIDFGERSQALLMW